MREQLNSFQRRLENGYRGIQHHFAQSERERQASMAEVDRLSERLGDVAQNLDVLMGSMQQNSERLRRYLSDNPPDPALPGDESDEDDLDLLLTNDIPRSTPIPATSRPLTAAIVIFTAPALPRCR